MSDIHPFAKSGFGMKGGAGPNSGKTSAKFRVPMPDGSSAIKRAFNCDVVDAEAFVYRHDAKWYVSGVWPRGRMPADLKRSALDKPDTSRVVAVERIG